MLLVSRSVSALLKKAGKNVRELDNQYQHDGFDILFSGQTRRARFKMSLWDHYVTMLRGDLNSASEHKNVTLGSLCHYVAGRLE
jgi:hypothetical protein